MKISVRQVLRGLRLYRAGSQQAVSLYIQRPLSEVFVYTLHFCMLCKRLLCTIGVRAAKGPRPVCLCFFDIVAIHLSTKKCKKKKNIFLQTRVWPNYVEKTIKNSVRQVLHGLRLYRAGSRQAVFLYIQTLLSEVFVYTLHFCMLCKRLLCTIGVRPAKGPRPFCICFSNGSLPSTCRQKNAKKQKNILL